MKKIIFALAIIASTVVVYSCKKKVTIDAATCAAVDTKYSTNVKNIVATKCAISGCHNANGSGKLGNYTTLAGIQADASSSLTQVFDKKMPAGGVTMTDAERNALMCWLQDGAPNN